MRANIDGVLDRVTQGVCVVEGPATGFLRDAFHGELVRAEYGLKLLPGTGKIAYVKRWISQRAESRDQDK